MSNNINEYQIIHRLNYLEEQNRILIAENNELKKKTLELENSIKWKYIDLDIKFNSLIKNQYNYFHPFDSIKTKVIREFVLYSLNGNCSGIILNESWKIVNIGPNFGGNAFTSQCASFHIYANSINNILNIYPFYISDDYYNENHYINRIYYR